MGDVNYQPVIDDMVWSFSRINCFHNCPYQWYLKYLYGADEEDMFFSSYGGFIHKLLDNYYSGRISADDAEIRYLTEFRDNVAHGAPSSAIFQRYFADGLRYISAPPPLPLENIRTEHKVRFTIGGLPFMGIIDVDGNCDGGFGILDHKSRTLRPKSGRKKPTATDEELDRYLRQLYLYSVPVLEERGELPSHLFFNCFRGTKAKPGERSENFIIKEPFDKDRFAEAKSWALRSIETIRNTEDFKPDVDFFKCKYLCGVHNQCEYYQMNFA
jgi:hypothetical protein